jgi:hypothetical protein
MAPMEYLEAWGTLIHEKNLKSKISCQTPFNPLSVNFSMATPTRSQREEEEREDQAEQLSPLRFFDWCSRSWAIGLTNFGLPHEFWLVGPVHPASTVQERV